MNLVIDGSAALAMLLPDEMASSEAVTINKAVGKAGSLLVPAHWWAEVTNGILQAEKRGRITLAESSELLNIAQGLGVVQDDETASRVPRDVISLARLHGLTVYDAAYLELAVRETATLATLDAALERAAVTSGVHTIP
ncbi:MAG: type II toxin-antitoxin system VapC family toxin [Opitutaceae bacterium]|jgi:predicted nucleic acid-binding protein|nr:type II toxin-antitoxin system VapC family toxin [Opitutaceae bacterium]